MKNIITKIANFFKKEVKDVENFDARFDTILVMDTKNAKAELNKLVSEIKTKAENKMQEYKIDLHNEISKVTNGIKKEKTALTMGIEKIVDDLNVLKDKVESLEQKEIDALKTDFNNKITALSEFLKKKVTIK